MPTVRPYWKGYIKLALVSCPIALYTASSYGERVAFRQINKKTGNRLRQQPIDDVTREPVEAAEKGRGYECENSYLRTNEEIDRSGRGSRPRSIRSPRLRSTGRSFSHSYPRPFSAASTGSRVTSSMSCCRSRLPVFLLIWRNATRSP